jgi:hypothetical protein
MAAFSLMLQENLSLEIAPGNVTFKSTAEENQGPDYRRVFPTGALWHIPWLMERKTYDAVNVSVRRGSH